MVFIIIFERRRKGDIMASVNKLVKLLPSPFPGFLVSSLAFAPSFASCFCSILSNFKVDAVAWQSVSIFGCLHRDLGRLASASLFFSRPFISRSIFCFYFLLLQVFYFAYFQYNLSLVFLPLLIFQSLMQEKSTFPNRTKPNKISIKLICSIECD